MAEYEERSLDDLTEEPSQSRLDELRQQGQVVQSRELTGVIVLAGVLSVTYYSCANVFIEFRTFFEQIAKVDFLVAVTEDTSVHLARVLPRVAKMISVSFIPVSLVAMTLGILASVSQVGFVVTFESLNPDFNRINPLEGFKKIFSLKSVVETVRSLFKILFLGALVYFSIRAQLDFLPAIVGLNPGALTQFFGSMAFRIFTSTLALLVVFAGIDYFIQWRRFRQQARMTKEEAKREQKEREGDPQVKARIRSVQRDMARKRMMKAIPTADVIITNPTHFAVAIRYNAEEGFAPRVVAKGADFLAERIKQIARENSIPTVENVILARTLYKSVKVGQMIPRSLYQAVAEVLAYVYKLRSKRL